VRSRRRWLADCSATLLLAPALIAWPCGAGAARAARPQKILVVGDSLSAEYGLQRGSGWVALLATRLAKEHPEASVVNASISGDTTSGGLVRLPALLRQHQPTLVVLELGGNDALRGLPLDTSRSNLTEMARLAKAANARVLILGMQIPPNYGPAYTQALAAVYPELAQRYDAALIEFLLADVALKRELMQPDGIHPNAAGQEIVFANVWRVLGPLLEPRDAG